MQLSKENLFARSEIFTAVLVVCLVVILTGYAAMKKQHRTDLVLAKKEIANYVEHVFNNISEITAATSSLSTLYKATGEYGTHELDEHTADLVKNTEFITSIGRYDHIKSADVDEFADLMGERGIYRFELKSLNAGGSVSPAGPREYYDAIVSISPFDPRAARLIGVDLGLNPQTQTAIQSAVSDNESVLTSYPPGWPKAADALLVFPTYAGRYTPLTSTSRATQTDGGYYIELSFTGLLRESDNVATTIKLPGKTLQEKGINTTDERYFRQLFQGEESVIRPSIGQSLISIEVRSADGVSQKIVLSAALWMLAALTLAAITLSIIMQKRRSDIKSREAQKSHEKERAIALTTLESINDAVFTLAPGGGIDYVNPAGETMVQQNANSILGLNIKSAIPTARGGSGNSALIEIESKLKTGTPTVLKELELLTDKSVTLVDCTFTPFSGLADTNGGVLVMRDVGKEKALNKRLEHLATHDSLTGLYNRYYFELRLDEMVKGATERGESHAVCYIDMDQFKIVNDTCGHQAGDKLLKKIADHLRDNCRKVDILARLGGDEFGLLIKDCDEQECETIAQRLHATLQSFFFTSGDRKFAIRACFGFVAINRAYDHVADVLAAADIACYSAKDRGRNEMFVFRPECEETSQRQGEMNMLPKLQNALSVDKFVLFAQPIARILPEGFDDTCKYELLLRMQDDDGSLITPYRLINAAERYDLMKEIDRWVINRAFHDIAELQSFCGENSPVFGINLSGQSVMDKDLIPYLLGKVAETKVDPTKICFEITETSAMGDLKQAQALLEVLKTIGSKVALDDFGAGECSFGYLKTLPVDYLKIDGQFVSNCDSCQVHREMLVFAQRVAGLLGMKTVAEFVENESILDTLRELGIDYAQGYHISKPFNIAELKAIGDIAKAA